MFSYLSIMAHQYPKKILPYSLTQHKTLIIFWCSNSILQLSWHKLTLWNVGSLLVGFINHNKVTTFNFKYRPMLTPISFLLIIYFKKVRHGSFAWYHYKLLNTSHRDMGYCFLIILLLISSHFKTLHFCTILLILKLLPIIIAIASHKFYSNYKMMVDTS